MWVPFNGFPIKWDKVSKPSLGMHFKDPWRSHHHFRRDRIRLMFSKAHPARTQRIHYRGPRAEAERQIGRQLWWNHLGEGGTKWRWKRWRIYLESTSDSIIR